MALRYTGKETNKGGTKPYARKQALSNLKGDLLIGSVDRPVDHEIRCGGDLRIGAVRLVMPSVIVVVDCFVCARELMLRLLLKYN